MTCSKVLREQGKPYPRTCPVHGLSPCETNPMLNVFTTCGRCELLSAACAVVTVKTVHKGYDTVELCQKCLDEMATMLRVFVEDRGSA